MFRRILIPTDGSPCADLAVGEGLALAVALGSEVTILHVVEEPISLYTDTLVYPTGLRQVLHEVGVEVLRSAAELAEAKGVDARVELVERGTSARSILEAAEDADLIVIGTHGRRGFDRLVFGSVAESVLRRSPVPCLAVRCAELDER